MQKCKQKASIRFVASLKDLASDCVKRERERERARTCRTSSERVFSTSRSIKVWRQVGLNGLDMERECRLVEACDCGCVCCSAFHFKRERERELS
jgi:hypothetical protein